MKPFVRLRTLANNPTGTVSVPKTADLNTSVPGQNSRKALVFIETYGCQMNVADSEMALGMLRNGGYERTTDFRVADLIVINTCSVRKRAEERVFARAQLLSAEKARRPGCVLAIIGCMAERLRDGIWQRVPSVDIVLGPDAYRRLLDAVERARAGEKICDTALNDRSETYSGLDSARELTNGVVGHAVIQRGCDKFCSFCVVPFARGRERSTPVEEITRQTRTMAAAGFKEIQLLGQTVNSYRDDELSFADLLHALADVDGIERIRFFSPYPVDFSPALVDALAGTPKVAKHVHLPLQTAAESVLTRMRRGYTFAQYRDLVRDLRSAVPDIGITTDLLVGFCGETEDEFRALLAGIEEIRFDAAFTFAYSEREGTLAARSSPDTVPIDVKRARLDTVIALQRRISAQLNDARIGRCERVLIECRSKRSANDWLGRTNEFRPVIVRGTADIHPGAFVDVVIERATSATLFGRRVV